MISSPLRSPVSPRPPLLVSLSLSTLSAPSRPSSAPPLGHLFDSLDDLRGSIGNEDSSPNANGVGLPVENGKGPGVGPRPRERSSALADWTSTLFPNVRLSEREQDKCQGERMPDWLRGTSGRVTAMVTARVTHPRPGQAGEEGSARAKSSSELRVIAGCEDGSVWIFAPPSAAHVPPDDLSPGLDSPRSPVPPPYSSKNPNSSSTYNKRGSLESLSIRSPSTSPANSSPPTSPRSRSLHTSIGLGLASRPPLSSRRSSSHSTLPTPLSPGGRIPSHRSSASINLANIDILPTVGRPRKASATVSMSTNGGTPSNGAATFPTHSTIPGPAPPSLILPSPSFNKRHNRSKASVTTGIGLWEHESVATASVYDDGPKSPDLAENEVLELPPEVDEVLESLEPILSLRLGGCGEISSLRIVEGTRFGKEEGGKVLLVLRRTGLLGVYSLVDGREFGTCDVGLQVPATRNTAVAFDGMEVLGFEDGVVSVCYGGLGVGFVVVDLDTMRPQQPVECGSSFVRPATIFKQGFHFLVFAASPPTSTTGERESPQLLVRPVLFDTDAASIKHGEKEDPSGNVRFGPPGSVGPLQSLSDVVLGIRNCADDLLAFDSTGVELFTIKEQRVVSLGFLSLPDVVDVSVEGYHAIFVSTLSENRCYKLDPAQSEDGALFDFVLLDAQPVFGTECSALLLRSPASTPSISTFLISRSTRSETRVIESVSIPRRTSPEAASKPSVEPRSLFESRVSRQDQVTSVHKLDRERALFGYSNGVLATVRYADLETSHQSPTIVAQLGGAISVLESCVVGERVVIIAGSSDGSAAALDVDNWQPIAHWSLFASPVSHIAFVKIPEGSRLSNTIAFISANSPIALVSLFPPRLHFVLPGTKSAVQSISTSDDEMLIVYAHGLSRVCNIEGLDLRRSMDLKTAEGVLAEGNWSTWFSLSKVRLSNGPTQTSQAEALLTIDLRADIEDALSLLPWAEIRRSATPVPPDEPDAETCDLVSDTKNSREQLGLVRLLLAQIASWGLDSDTDELLVEHLSIARPSASLSSALQSPGSLAIPIISSPASPWMLSPTATAQRLLRVVCLLRVFLNFPDTERYASEAIVFYASFLAESVGPLFVFPALEVLADFWLDGSPEVQQAARLLFGSYLLASSDDRVLALVEKWQNLLPSRQPHDSFHDTSTEQAVLILGLIAAEKFKLLPAALLTDISESITAFLADEEHPYHQAIATELCTRGFEIWQNYVDAMPLVRQLFGLATGKNPATPFDLRNLARSATLHVAGVNTPLFMTTLSFDILNAQSAKNRNATMKLLGFMVRKKPLVLYTSLPRLAEAVVKSLDPTVTHLRESVQQAATVILNELVRTYPSIDFHGKSQRLAVGTHEGAAIVYDLKTATRLYVLEGHTRAITALTWSPDGRRLVSVSLEESRVVVWKVGVGILSMFTPGVPPRQGSGGFATPFKTLDFAVGDEGHMTTAATLEWVTFEWPGERTTRLRIRETALTFAV
ncbi:hypothetical protein P7C70_g1446, partial [Phenoliferia sp. Uapishka_3]